jgi:hypothetical protein
MSQYKSFFKRPSLGRFQKLKRDQPFRLAHSKVSSLEQVKEGEM